MSRNGYTGLALLTAAALAATATAAPKQPEGKFVDTSVVVLNEAGTVVQRYDDPCGTTMELPSGDYRMRMFVNAAGVEEVTLQRTTTRPGKRRGKTYTQPQRTVNTIEFEAGEDGLLAIHAHLDGYIPKAPGGSVDTVLILDGEPICEFRVERPQTPSYRPGPKEGYFFFLFYYKKIRYSNQI